LIFGKAEMERKLFLVPAEQRLRPCLPRARLQGAGPRDRLPV